MLIIVSGLPGSGKSYLAKRLAERLGAEYINSDATRKAMNALGQYAFEDKLNVYEEMANRAGDNLRHGKTVVVDATFYHHQMRDLFLTLGKLLHKPICYLEVQAEEALIQDRLSRPRPDSEADFAVYQQLKLQYEAPAVDHLVLHSNNENISDLLDEALEYIQDTHERKTG